MKTRYLFFTVFAVLCFACNSSDDGVTPELSTYEFYTDSNMVFTNNQGFETVSIEPGTNSVFKYSFTAEEDENIADDEYTETLYFEVDGSLDNFSYSNGELRGLNLAIRRLCFCPNVDFIFPQVGTVTGSKQSNGNWDISISISFQWDAQSETVSRTINGTFQPSTDN